ncbi:MAG: PIN domain-containing protein, partial [Tunicatimonas sp.]
FHHRDPFDRLIIAQAKSEGLTLISKDGKFGDYNINLLWKE